MAEKADRAVRAYTAVGADRAVVRLVRLAILAATTACATTPQPTATSPAPVEPSAPDRLVRPPSDTVISRLPPIPPVKGPLAITVIYPAATDVVDARDSSFIFGSAGTGDASVTVNGFQVPVAPNGAWLAWIPLPPDSILQFEIVARTATDSARLVYPAKRVRRFVPPPGGVWIDSNSVAPRGKAWWPADEYLPVSVRAIEGAQVRIRLPNGTIIPLAADQRPDDVPVAIRAFDRDTMNLAPAPRRADRYVGVIRGVAVGESPGALLGEQSGQGGQGGRCCMTASSARSPSTAPSASSVPTAMIEAIIGPDTARMVWPLQLALLDTLPALVEFNDDTAHKGDTDSLTIGRTRPGATYHWFMPTGTRTQAVGRLGDDLRVRLSRGTEAWVPAVDALAVPAGTPALRATAGSITVTPYTDRISLRVPLSFRVPFRVEEETGRLTLRLYNTFGDLDWMRYGQSDAYLSQLSWLQAADDELTIQLDLGGPVWGYRARWNRSDLILEIRRPPPIDDDHPLKGRRIVVDPGHPPGGAMGPTGLREAEANLSVALQLRDLLVAAGAEVVMTRDTDTSIDLFPRVKFADSVNAELLISIHNNALPDGVNPITNNGTSVFYNQPRSVPLAQAVQRALVKQLGLRNLGVARGDLALVRPTWMPSILTEGLFMMIPAQESALRSREGQAAYARGVFDGIETFLKSVASEGGKRVP